jgi:hypothetical protein
VSLGFGHVLRPRPHRFERRVHLAQVAPAATRSPHAPPALPAPYLTSVREAGGRGGGVLCASAGRSLQQGITAGLAGGGLGGGLRRTASARAPAGLARRVRGAFAERTKFARQRLRGEARNATRGRTAVKHTDLERVSRRDLLVMLNRCRKCDLLPASWHSPLERCEGNGSRIEQRPPFVRRIL